LQGNFRESRFGWHKVPSDNLVAEADAGSKIYGNGSDPSNIGPLSPGVGTSASTLRNTPGTPSVDVQVSTAQQWRAHPASVPRSGPYGRAFD